MLHNQNYMKPGSKSLNYGICNRLEVFMQEDSEQAQTRQVSQSADKFYLIKWQVHLSHSVTDQSTY